MFNFRLPEFFFFLCLQCIAITVCAQYSESNKIEFGVNDGLPSSTCYDLVQDAKGFLWICSEGGLIRYDGYEFKNYNTSDGLVDNEIINLEQDRRGRIWMNTNGPLSYILDDSVHVIPSENNSILHSNFKVVDDGKFIWVNRISGLDVYDAESLNQVEVEKPTSDKLRIIRLAGIHNGAAWIINRNILYKYQGTNIVDSFVVKNLPDAIISRSYYFGIHGGDLYYADETNLYKIDLETLEQAIFTPVDAPVRQITLKSDQLWVLTQNSLNKYSLNENGIVIDQDKMLEGALCSKFLFDESDNLWGAIYKKGLMMISQNNRNITYTPLHSGKPINLESILVQEDKIVLGSEKGNLFIIDQDGMESYNTSDEKFLSVNRIIDIIPIAGNGYLLSKDSGIYHFVSGKFKKLINTTCKNIFLDKDRLLINTYDFLYEASLESLLSQDRILNLRNSKDGVKCVQPSRAYTSLIRKDGEIWNATVIEGLSVINQKDTFYFKELSNMFNCTISRLLEIDGGIICAVTKGEGLILIKDRTFKQINELNGLSSNFCYDIDAIGNQIFVATNKGVSIVDLKDFDSFDFKVKIVDMHNGIPSNEVQDVGYRDSTLYLATNKGFLSYDLSETETKSKDREVFVENFSVNGESMPLLDEYSLNAHDNNIRINLISPSIGSKRNTLYAYQMKGVDDTWIKTTSAETHYRNLESGNYEFQYKLSTSDKYEEVKSIMVEVRPRVVQSNWFKIMVLAALGCVFMVPLYLSYTSQKRNLLVNLLSKKSDEVNEKMRLLEKSNKRLVSSNKELEQFAYIASHDLQEPINTIKGFTDVLTNRLEESNDQEALKMLTMISNSSTRMKELVKDLLVYSRIGKEKKKSMVDMNSLMTAITKDLTDRIESNNAEVTWDNLSYIPGYQVELRSLIQNLLSNAMKFQRPGVPPKIHISSTNIEGGVEISVKDNGIGISEEYRERIFEIFQRLHNKDQYEGTGIGLAHCKKIVNLHNGKIWVESVPEGGSNFKFTLEV